MKRIRTPSSKPPDRALGYGKRLRNLFVRPLFDVGHRSHRALGWRQLGEGLANTILNVGGHGGVSLPGAEVGKRCFVGRHLRATSAQMTDRQIHSDSPRPRSKIARGIKPLARTMNAQKRLYHQLFGHARITNHLHDPTVNIALKFAKQLFKRSFVALGEAFQKLVRLAVHDANFR